MEFIERRKYEKERDRILREAAMDGFKTALVDGTAYPGEANEVLNLAKKLDDMARKINKERIESFNDTFKLPVEIAKVAIPIVGYAVLGKAFLYFEEHGSAQYSLTRALMGSKPRFF